MVCFNIYILFHHKDTFQEHEKYKKLAQLGFIILTVHKKYDLHPSYTIIIHIDINTYIW